MVYLQNWWDIGGFSTKNDNLKLGAGYTINNLGYLRIEFLQNGHDWGLFGSLMDSSISHHGSFRHRLMAKHCFSQRAVQDRGINFQPRYQGGLYGTGISPRKGFAPGWRNSTYLGQYLAMKRQDICDFSFPRSQGYHELRWAFFVQKPLEPEVLLVLGSSGYSHNCGCP